MSQALPVIDLKGTPHEIGLAHGRALKEEIHDFLATVTRVHQANNAALKVDRKPLAAFCMRNLGFLEKFSPELVEEMRGIAQGAGVTLEDIVYLNSFLELEDLRAPALGAKNLSDSLWGCTTFTVAPEAGADGRTYIGQTYDMEKQYEKYLAILRVEPEGGPAMLAVTLAGVLGINGLNSAGVGVVINKVAATDARPGVVYPFVIRKALAAERIGDALGAVVHTQRACGMTYQLAGSGLAFCIEVSATNYKLLPVDGAMAHTNHYVSDFMRRFETPNWLSHGGTMVRKQVADAFLRRHKGGLTPDLLKELSRDHTNHPRCICAHGFPDEGPLTAFQTIFAVVMDPEQGWMDICRGNPCENEYTRHALGPGKGPDAAP